MTLSGTVLQDAVSSALDEVPSLKMMEESPAMTSAEAAADATTQKETRRCRCMLYLVKLEGSDLPVSGQNEAARQEEAPCR